MSRHTRTLRPMRDEERARATKLAGSDASSHGFLAVVCIAGSIGFGFFLGWLAARFDPEALLVGRIVGWGLGLGLWAILAWSFRKSEAVVRARFAEDVKRGEVEELTVETDEAVNLETDHATVTPAIAIEIGEGELLLLAGPALSAPALYDAKDAPSDDHATRAWWNALPPPHAFPSRKFVVTRLPTSGEILGIRATGEYLAPARTAGVDLRMYDPLPSEIVPGTTARVTEAFPPR